MAHARTLLPVLFWTAVAVSIVHYADNVLAWNDYPQPTSGPAPSAGVIAAAWFVFTGIGLTGYGLFLRERWRGAAAALAVYSGSGLVGLGHYTVDGAGAMPWWRHAHIVADVACGAAILAFAVWLARRAAQPMRSTPTTRPS